MMPPLESALADLCLERAWRAAVHEILGPEGALPEGVSPLPWESLLPTLCARYGEVAGLGLGLRVGRAFARQMVPHIAETPAFQAVEFRFLPWPRKMVAGLQHIAALASAWFEMQVHIETVSRGLLWLPEGCPFTPQGAEARRCTPWEGFLQEILYWLSGGHLFLVESLQGRPLALYIPQLPLH